MFLYMTPEYDSRQFTPEWLQTYRNPMDGSRNWFHTQVTSLPLADGASQKYSEQGEVKPLEGLSLVTFLDPKSTLVQQLTLETQRLETAFINEGLEDSFVFLPKHTWHVTIADLAVSTDKQMQEAIIKKVHTSFLTLKDKLIQTPVYHFRSDFVVSAGISLVCLAEPNSEQDLQSIHEVRHRITEDLQPLGLPLQDPEKFIGHATIAYFKKSLDTEQYGKFKNCIKKTDVSGHTLGELQIDKIELRRFASMEDWGDKSVDTLTLG
ncbi:MAG: DUF1868 domain-containing protein [Candidatus Gottesmanbacteria bacterium]